MTRSVVSRASSSPWRRFIFGSFAAFLIIWANTGRTRRRDGPVDIGAGDGWSLLRPKEYPEGYDYCRAKYLGAEGYRSLSKTHNLQTLHIITRHGDRTPALPFPDTPNSPPTWVNACPPTEYAHLTPSERGFLKTLSLGDDDDEKEYWAGRCNLGQLTYRGIEQMKDVGRAVREVYLTGRVEWEGGKTPGLEEARFRSTDVWRTVQSAQYFVNELFPVGNASSVGEQQPVPLEIRPRPIDALGLRLGSADLRALYRKTRAHDRAFLAYHQLSTQFAAHMNDAVQADYEYSLESWFDLLQTRGCHGYELPCAAGKDTCLIARDVESTVWLAHEWLRLEYDTQMGDRRKESVMRIGPLVREILSKRRSDTRIHHYSAHDTTLSGLLAVLASGSHTLKLQQAAHAWPPYASMLVIEVWKPKEESLSNDGGDGEGLDVRILYNGEVMPWLINGEVKEVIAWSKLRSPLADWLDA